MTLFKRATTTALTGAALFLLSIPIGGSAVRAEEPQTPALSQQLAAQPFNRNYEVDQGMTRPAGPDEIWESRADKHTTEFLAGSRTPSSDRQAAPPVQVIGTPPLPADEPLA